MTPNLQLSKKKQQVKETAKRASEVEEKAANLSKDRFFIPGRTRSKERKAGNVLLILLELRRFSIRLLRSPLCLCFPDASCLLLRFMDFLFSEQWTRNP